MVPVQLIRKLFDTNLFSGNLMTVPQKCAAGTVCCSNACVVPDDIACGTLIHSPSLITSISSIPIVQSNISPCREIAENDIVKLDNITARQSCAPGTVCCADSDTNRCDYKHNCNNILPKFPYNASTNLITLNPPVNVCLNIADGASACVNPSGYVKCRGGFAVTSSLEQRAALELVLIPELPFLILFAALVPEVWITVLYVQV
ncbi:hypothetical protein HK100_007897 [Physocladia obscura]|uniref:Uncharacterized protein n=1 Tax=Physocladia obscura TaxID=109957 RepID=A0AAD5T4L7_9FUNG|nr:hypothetical protein HK100_007897 [Physocladia obscura]